VICRAIAAKAVPHMKSTKSESNRAFLVAVGTSLLLGALLMFGSLQYAATHMQVTM
jgi:hypothetical protein